jgi:hypothetical protein
VDFYEFCIQLNGKSTQGKAVVSKLDTKIISSAEVGWRKLTTSSSFEFTSSIPAGSILYEKCYSLLILLVSIPYVLVICRQSENKNFSVTICKLSVVEANLFCLRLLLNLLVFDAVHSYIIVAKVVQSGVEQI